MSTHDPQSRVTLPSNLARYLIGITSGVLLSLLSALIPVVAFGLVAIANVATWISLLRRSDSDRKWSLAGLSIGSGAALLYAAASTVLSCALTDNFCGNANVAPLLAFALFGLASGVIASIVAFASRR